MRVLVCREKRSHLEDNIYKDQYIIYHPAKYYLTSDHKLVSGDSVLWENGLFFVSSRAWVGEHLDPGEGPVLMDLIARRVQEGEGAVTEFEIKQP